MSVNEKGNRRPDGASIALPFLELEGTYYWNPGSPSAPRLTLSGGLGIGGGGAHLVFLRKGMTSEDSLGYGANAAIAPTIFPSVTVNASIPDEHGIPKPWDAKVSSIEAGASLPGLNGNVKPIGYLPSDTLRLHKNHGPYNADLKKAEVISGDRTAIINLWAAAGAAGDKINALNLRYPFMRLGQNSNSVPSTLIAAMGVAEPSVGGAPLTPGEGSILLDLGEIQQIQRQYKLNIPKPQGVQDTRPSSRSPGQIDQSDQQWPVVVAQPPRGAVGAPTGRRTMLPRRNGSSGATVSKPPDTTAPDAAEPRSTGGAIRSTPPAPPARPGASGPSGSASGSRPMSPLLNFAPEEPQDFGPFTAPAPLHSGLFGISNAFAAARQIASADANEANSSALALGAPTTSDPVLGNSSTSKLDDGNGGDGWSEGLVPVPFFGSRELIQPRHQPEIRPVASWAC